jgi:hypothetical protein
MSVLFQCPLDPHFLVVSGANYLPYMEVVETGIKGHN